jgi:hypothetical protein
VIGPHYEVTWRHAGPVSTDAEGRSTYPYTDETSMRVVGSASVADEQIAAMSGSQVDAVVLIELGLPVNPADMFVVANSGGSLDGEFRTVVVRFTSMHQRVLLRRHEPAA